MGLGTFFIKFESTSEVRDFGLILKKTFASQVRVPEINNELLI